MACTTCLQNNSLPNVNYKCVDTALATIRQHFDLLFKEAEDRINELKTVKEANDKLRRAVEFLQRTKDDGNKCGKLAEQVVGTPKKNYFTTSFIGDISDNSVQSEPLDLDLNLALNSQQLLDTSALSQSQNETIAETEQPTSPAVRHNWNAKRKQKQDNIENQKPSITANNSRVNKRESPKRTLFLKSKTVLSPIQRKVNLSLNRNLNKMKQTRLKFDIKQDKGTSKSKNTDKEVIDASPNLYTSLKQAENARSLLLRGDNSSVASEDSDKSKSYQKSKKTKLEYRDDDIGEHYFVFSDTKCPTPKRNLGKIENQKTQIPNSNTSSVVMLTPVTQDIIFLDDTCNETKQIETMDLMADLLKLDYDDSLDNLKRIESKIIEKQKTANKLSTKNCDAKNKATPLAPFAFKEEPTTGLQESADESTKLEDKLENSAQDEDDELDSDFALPIQIKCESDIPTKQQKLKERLNISCHECQNYIEFFADKFNSKQIEAHLRKCKHKRDKERLGHETPIGFWNPLMLSFAENDPRNEVLIDNRFAGKKRNN